MEVGVEGGVSRVSDMEGVRWKGASELDNSDAKRERAEIQLLDNDTNNENNKNDDHSTASNGL